MPTYIPSPDSVRAAPHNVEAEEAVLGSMLIDPECVSNVLMVLDRSDFFIEKNGWVYDAILCLNQAGDPLDFVTLCNCLEDNKRLIEVGGSAYLTHLINVVPSAIHALGYAGIVKEAAAKRRILSLASSAATMAYNGKKPVDALDDLIREATRIRTHIATDDSEAPEQPIALVPDLPNDVMLPESMGAEAGHVITQYMLYALSVSPMTPGLFHESAALWLGSVAIARRLKAALPHDDVYTNLFVAWLAPSTLWRKTTGLNVARRMAYKTFAHMIAPADFTIEGFLSDWSGTEPNNLNTLPVESQELWRKSRNYSAQRGIALDEMSSLLAGAGRDYNAGMVETFLRFFSCEELYTRNTRGTGYMVIRNAYLTFIGASTPLAISTHMLGDHLWGNGWWPRFALLSPEGDRPAYFDSQDEPEPVGVIRAMHALYERLPQAEWPNPPGALSVIMGEGVLPAWKKYARCVGHDMVTDALDNRLWYVYGRLPDQLIKTAVIISALDWATDGAGQVPTVEMSHLARAMTIVEQWRRSAHRVIDEVTTSAGNRFLQRILRAVIAAGERGVTLRDLYRTMRDKMPYEVGNAMQQLVDMNEVEAIDMLPGKAGGRRTVRYKVTKH